MTKRIFLLSFFLLSSFFFLIPITNISHVEALSYMVEAASLLYPDVYLTDTIWPLNAEYFFFSRAGTVLALRPFSLLAPGEGFRLLMWVTAPIFLTGLVLLVRRWSQSDWVACLSAVATVPVVFESTLFFNDSMPASALAFWALALCFSRGWVGIFLGGLTIGVALFFRLDQIFQLPMAALILFFTASGFALGLARVALFFGAFAALYLALEAIFTPGVGVADRLSISSGLPELWGWTLRPLTDDIARDATVFLIAVGQALPLALFGLVVFASSQSFGKTAMTWTHVQTLAKYAALVLYPTFFCLILLGLNAVPRQFLVLVPQVAVLCAFATQFILDRPLLSWKSVLASACLFLCLVPTPEFLWRGVSEAASQQVTGRLWIYEARRAWQDIRTEEQIAAEEIFAQLPPAPKEILFMVRNGGGVDRALQVVLLREGYGPVPRDQSSCGLVAEEWRLGARRLFVYRTHVPHLWAPRFPDKFAQEAAIYFAHGDACIQTFDTAARYVDGLLVIGDRPISELAGASPGVMALSDDVRFLVERGYRTHLLHAASHASIEQFSRSMFEGFKEDLRRRVE